MINSIKTLNQWMDTSLKDNGWVGIFSMLLVVTIPYLFMRLSGRLSTFGLIMLNIMYGWCWLCCVVGAVRLINKRKIKKLADERMEEEIQARTE